jgi:hypothetical protein
MEENFYNVSFAFFNCGAVKCDYVFCVLFLGFKWNWTWHGILEFKGNLELLCFWAEI